MAATLNRVQADAVCYGRAIGGGLPLGAVCGPSWLLAASEPHLPLRAFAAHFPALSSGERQGLADNEDLFNN